MLGSGSSPAQNLQLQVGDPRHTVEDRAAIHHDRRRRNHPVLACQAHMDRDVELGDGDVCVCRRELPDDRPRRGAAKAVFAVKELNEMLHAAG